MGGGGGESAGAAGAHTAGGRGAGGGSNPPHSAPALAVEGMLAPSTMYLQPWATSDLAPSRSSSACVGRSRLGEKGCATCWRPAAALALCPAPPPLQHPHTHLGRAGEGHVNGRVQLPGLAPARGWGPEPGVRWAPGKRSTATVRTPLESSAPSARAPRAPVAKVLHAGRLQVLQLAVVGALDALHHRHVGGGQPALLVDIAPVAAAGRAALGPGPSCPRPPAPTAGRAGQRERLRTRAPRALTCCRSGPAPLRPQSAASRRRTQPRCLRPRVNSPGLGRARQALGSAGTLPLPPTKLCLAAQAATLPGSHRARLRAPEPLTTQRFPL